MIGLVFAEEANQQQGERMERETVCVDDFFGCQTQLNMNRSCVHWVLDFVATCFGKIIGDRVANVDKEGEDDSGMEGTMEE